MADAYRSLPINSDASPADVMPKARAAAEKALQIDSSLADAHIAIGWIGFWYDHNWIQAESEFKTALKIAPNNPDAYRGYSVMLTCLGRHDEAIANMARARNLDPLSLITGALEGQSYLYAGRYSEAVASLNKTFEIDPNFWVAHVQFARLHIFRNEFDLAVAEAEKAKIFSGGNSEALSLAGYAYAKSGRKDQAVMILSNLKAMAANGLAVDYNLAMLENGLGNTEESLNALEDAVRKHDVRLILIKVDPRWDNLRSNPRFVGVIQSINFQ
jgi:tetratricopeptide (TPR) repeat protein